MSGAGRHHKAKHVHQQMDDTEVFLDPTQVVGRCGMPAGNNLFEVELSEGHIVLGKMPKKLHNVVWLQRGDVLVVSAISEEDLKTAAAEGSKATTEIVRKLTLEQVKMMATKGSIPAKYMPPMKPSREPMKLISSSDDEKDKQETENMN